LASLLYNDSFLGQSKWQKYRSDLINRSILSPSFAKHISRGIHPMSLRVGDTIPDVTLLDPSGREIKLFEQIHQPTLIVFLRHLM
jgi:hypothetical protein